jgi:hypothetical protein
VQTHGHPFPQPGMSRFLLPVSVVGTVIGGTVLLK